jgi:hypothetical protein
MAKTLEKIGLIPYTFVVMNWAPVAGLIQFLRGRPLGIWNRNEPEQACFVPSVVRCDKLRTSDHSPKIRPAWPQDARLGIPAHSQSK